MVVSSINIIDAMKKGTIEEEIQRFIKIANTDSCFMPVKTDWKMNILFLLSKQFFKTGSESSSVSAKYLLFPAWLINIMLLK